MPDTIDVLRAEHKNMARILDLLERQVALFEEAAEPDYELIGQIIDYFRRFPDLYHHPKEEVVLTCLRKRAPDQAKRIGDLEGDHEGCSDNLQKLTRLVVQVLMGEEVSRETFVREAHEFIENERRHMRGEEDVFFPIVLQNLTREDWLAIDEKVHRFRDPLSEPDKPFRFDLLRKHLQ